MNTLSPIRRPKIKISFFVSISFTQASIAPGRCLAYLRNRDYPFSSTARTRTPGPGVPAFRASGLTGLSAQPIQESSVLIRHITHKSASLNRFCVESEPCRRFGEVEYIFRYIVGNGGSIPCAIIELHPLLQLCGSGILCRKSHGLLHATILINVCYSGLG